MLDAPVSGGEVGAINASLSIVVGGDEAAFARARQVFARTGHPDRIIHIGREPGSGQIFKICNQLAEPGLVLFDVAVERRHESGEERDQPLLISKPSFPLPATDSSSR